MGANDKTEATFHGAENMRPMTPDELEANGYPRDFHEKRKELQEARLAELQAATEEEADKNARESREFNPMEDSFEQDDSGKIWPIEPGNVVPIPDNGIAGIPDNLMLNAGLEVLIQQSGQNSKDHGFHDDFPDVDKTPVNELGLAVTQKLTLIMEEVIEAFGEIRDGRSTKEIYFVDKKGQMGGPDPVGFEYSRQYYGLPGDNDRHPEELPCREGDVPLLKPEGFMVELADAVIRIADLVYLLEGQEEFIEALHAKHEYNKTRPFKHGRQF